MPIPDVGEEWFEKGGIGAVEGEEAADQVLDQVEAATTSSRSPSG